MKKIAFVGAGQMGGAFLEGLAAAGTENAMRSVLNSLKKTQSNPQFLLALDLKNLQ